MKTLIVTNDFPTRRGGIETFVQALAERFPPEAVVVYTARMPGDAAHDAAQPFAVHRDPNGTLLPTPAVADRVLRVFTESGCDRVVFGASAPLGLLAPRLRAAGAVRIVALTHGHEGWWARVPGTRAALHRIGEECDLLTYVSDWCRDRIAPALSPAARERMRRLSPGVDTDRFRPDCGGAQVRARWGIGAEAPVVVCTARLVRRKGQDTLIRAWPEVLAAVPEARLLLVGDGPYRKDLARLAAPLGEAVVFTGAVPWSQMPAHTDAGDVFAMPCRTRLGGLEPEAFGIVCLEAAAVGLPVLVGNSGGAPETVEDGVTGFVVDAAEADGVAEVAARLVRLLQDPAVAAKMGRAGRERARDWSWDAAAARLQNLLG